MYLPHSGECDHASFLMATLLMLRVPGRGNSCWEINLHCITVLMIIACLLLNNCDVVKCFNQFFALYYLIKRSVKKNSTADASYGSETPEDVC